MALNELMDETTPKIAVEAGIVYILGSFDGEPVYWRDDGEIWELVQPSFSLGYAESAFVNAIAVENGILYAVGDLYDNEKYAPVFWKGNSDPVPLRLDVDSGGSSSVALAVRGSNVYIAGSVYSETADATTAVAWINGGFVNFGAGSAQSILIDIDLPESDTAATAAANSFELTVDSDSVLPSFAIQAVPSIINPGQSITLSPSITDAEGYSLYLDGVEDLNASYSNGELFYTLPSELSGGRHTLTVVAELGELALTASAGFLTPPYITGTGGVWPSGDTRTLSWPFITQPEAYEFLLDGLDVTADAVISPLSSSMEIVYAPPVGLDCGYHTITFIGYYNGSTETREASASFISPLLIVSQPSIALPLETVAIGTNAMSAAYTLKLSLTDASVVNDSGTTDASGYLTFTAPDQVGLVQIDIEVEVDGEYSAAMTSLSVQE